MLRKNVEQDVEDSKIIDHNMIGDQRHQQRTGTAAAAAQISCPDRLDCVRQRKTDARKINGEYRE